ncbi:MAG: 16S rRNA (cytosine(1402)-N(4))-methyltransferase RsmH [Bryobacterales bacterium]|nr:16S rRNA (cytosine(1402)-N(4))-methyltransferase RsmH [Bryobacterales bacterium]MDE0626259.1 16S rRNA (cytosine(1402)-N(4))-methyltransferase RsmH [Bryobacterales bacterium]
MSEHYPVMADEMERYLLGEARAGERRTYCDCTAGSGGHARRILARTSRSRLVAIDRDASALERCRSSLREFEGRVTYCHGAFSRIAEAVREHQPIAGILADLGLSRTQLDDAGRGFSLRLEGPLDMRFDRRQELCAWDLVNRGSERELADLLYRLADERFSRRIARAVVRARPVRDTRHLAEIAAGAVPRGARRRIHPATRTFQALRMAVNDEIRELRALLDAAPGLLAPGGRFVVISFHSGEDRLVKHSFRRLAAAGTHRVLTRRVVRPPAAEVARNRASRSARLRAVCRARGAGARK